MRREAERRRWKLLYHDKMWYRKMESLEARYATRDFCKFAREADKEIYRQYRDERKLEYPR